MEARLGRAVPVLAPFAVLLAFCIALPAAGAAGYKTTNFVVSAPTPQLAKEIGDQAEVYRRELSLEWLGQEMPNWSRPCPINARVAPNLGAGGATSFVFDRGEVFDWQMNIQGSHERILDSVLPHEITHTIFASHFRQPLPRWADEGACTTVEDRSEVAKQERMLIDFLKNRRGIPFVQMFSMKEYPSDVMPLYSQGHSVAQWLIESRGRKAFLEFLADGMQDDNWPRAVRTHYGFENLYAMQNGWLDWVKEGRPQLSPSASPIGLLASHTGPPTGSGTPAPRAIYRGQSPDGVPSSPAVASPASEAASPWTAASSGSVYAAAAARAKASGIQGTSARPAIHDASNGARTLRR